MTAKQAYQAVAIELSKIQLPILKLSEFNYYINQAIGQFVNKIYNIYDTSQQTTDDLRVLKNTATLIPKQLPDMGQDNILNYIQQSKYIIDLPSDYLHLLNCICLFTLNRNYGCQHAGSIMAVGASKLTADNFSSVMEDYYNKPSVKHPYYYINNQNTISLDYENPDINIQLPTNPITDSPAGFNRTFNFNDVCSTVDKPAKSRYANAVNPRMEIHCGMDNLGELKAVQVDYLKAPQLIKLTQEQLDKIQDESQILEFPDYVNQEIINELVNLIMVKTNNPNVSSHLQITQSIARPTGQQQ